METCQRSVSSLRPDDIEGVVSVHCAAFPQAALTQLGKEAVGRFYRSLLLSPHEIYAFGARVDGRLAGFCFGGIAPTAMPNFLRQNRGLLARRLMLRPWLVIDPMFRHRLARAFSAILGKRPPVIASTLPDGRRRPYDILSIAVDPRNQGQGVGKALMERAQATARQNGFHVMTLMVNTDNKQAIRFYESIGWKKLLSKGVWRGNMELWF
jgi:ribosomal protein S18 acetylase RimI-like enzyme